MAEGFLQPPPQHDGNGDDHDRGAVANQEPGPGPAQRAGHGGGTAETGRMHQHDRGNGQDHQRQRHPNGDCPDGLAGAPLGRGRPLFQERLFQGLHPGHRGPQLVHDLLALVAQNSRQGAFKTRPLSQFDRFPQLGELGIR